MLRARVLHYLPDIAIAADRPRRLRLGLADRRGRSALAGRWGALSPADRARIAAAARSGSLLASEEEIELAAGFARRDRRRRRPTRLIAAIDLPLGALLILGGLVADAGIFIAFGALFLLLGLLRLDRAHQSRAASARRSPAPAATEDAARAGGA